MECRGRLTFLMHLGILGVAIMGMRIVSTIHMICMIV